MSDPAVRRRLTRRSGRSAVLLLAVGATSVAMTLFGVPSAQAVDPGVTVTNNFELEPTIPLNVDSHGNVIAETSGTTSDPNAVDDAAAGDDWANVYNKSRNAANPDHAQASKFITDAVNSTPDEKLFTGGGSKDPTDITGWKWTTGPGVQDKNDIEHAYAARYAATTTQPAYLFFGLDRYATAGDATLGFWFLKGAVAPVTVNGVNSFSGQHQNNDLLVQIDYTNGGAQPIVAVSKWCTAVDLAHSCASIGLNNLAQSNTQLCGFSNTQTYCAATNLHEEDAPWSFIVKNPNTGDSGTDLSARTFFEGGINLKEFGFDRECFSTFLAETRSSQSFTSTLSDFAMDSFAPCTADLTTAPSGGVTSAVLPGVPVNDVATITGQGVSSPPYPNSSTTLPGKGNKVKFYLCGPIATGTCSSTANPVLPDGDLSPTSTQGVSTATSGNVNTSLNPLTPGRYCWLATWAGDANYPAITAESNPADECFRVKDTTTTTSAQNWLPNDSATVTSGSSGTTVAGTIAFQLYESSNCTTGIVTAQHYSEHKSGTHTITSSTNNSTYLVTANKTVSWLVTFTSDDTNLVESSSHCETSTVTVTN